MSETLIKQLQNADLYSHPVSDFNVFETHGSWVITTGEFVYKIKKPVHFPFLDYSTLAKRKHYCEQELKLNSEMAAQIYIDVVPIYGNEEHPSFAAQGEPIEYAVKMREFSQQQLFSQLLKNHKLSTDIIDQLALSIVAFHKNITVAGDEITYGSAEQTHQLAMDNFSETLALLTDADDIAQLKQLETLTEQAYQRIKPIMATRKAKGFIRQTHGDIHLNNIVLIDGKPVIFDRIEFNESFIWNDTMADLGFIVMDLDEHGQTAFANRLANRYFEYSGDYEGVKLLPYNCAYRAMVRAKVDQFRLQQPGLSEIEIASIKRHYQACLSLVENYLQLTTPQLFITHGVSASGKSTVAKIVVEKAGAIQLRSDLERKRLANIDLFENTESPLLADYYSPEFSEKVYAQLLELARDVIAAGFTVVVDASFLTAAQRQPFENLATELNIPYTILHCHAPADTLRQWMTERAETNTRNVSEARLDILEHQLQQDDDFTDTEKQHIVPINTTKTINFDFLG
tara:strand:- start:52316 stop:53857 length:1542 start_codon:yes stop_codon:yes gene_type:complete